MLLPQARKSPKYPETKTIFAQSRLRQWRMTASFQSRHISVTTPQNIHIRNLWIYKLRILNDPESHRTGLGKSAILLGEVLDVE